MDVIEIESSTSEDGSFDFGLSDTSLIDEAEDQQVNSAQSFTTGNNHSIDRTELQGVSGMLDTSQSYKKEPVHSFTRPNFDSRMETKRNGETTKGENSVIGPSSFAGGNSINALTRFKPSQSVDEKFRKLPNTLMESRGSNAWVLITMYLMYHMHADMHYFNM